MEARSWRETSLFARGPGDRGPAPPALAAFGRRNRSRVAPAGFLRDSPRNLDAQPARPLCSDTLSPPEALVGALGSGPGPFVFRCGVRLLRRVGRAALGRRSRATRALAPARRSAGCGAERQAAARDAAFRDALTVGVEGDGHRALVWLEFGDSHRARRRPLFRSRSGRTGAPPDRAVAPRSHDAAGARAAGRRRTPVFAHRAAPAPQRAGARRGTRGARSGQPRARPRARGRRDRLPARELSRAPP